MASWWATHRGPVTLVDLDPQDTGSATWWLDRCDDSIANLSWLKATNAELDRQLARCTTTTVIVDTAPRLDDSSLHHVAHVVDLVVIPGSISEFPTILQTWHTVRPTGVPAVAVITRTLTASLKGANGQEVLDVIEAEGLLIAGAIRQNNALAESVALGRRPDQLAGDPRLRIEEDVRTLMLLISNMVAPTKEGSHHG